jgi:hypothetical protein
MYPTLLRNYAGLAMCGFTLQQGSTVQLRTEIGPRVPVIRWESTSRSILTEYGLASRFLTRSLQSRPKKYHQAERTNRDQTLEHHKLFAGVDWFSDGKSAVAALERKNGVLLVRIDATGLETGTVLNTTVIRVLGCPSVEPGKDNVAFHAEDGVYVCTSSGAGLRRVLRGRPENIAPLWSPLGGRFVAAIRDENAHTVSLHLVNTDTGHVRKLHPLTLAIADLTNVSWVASGRTLLFQGVFGPKRSLVEDLFYLTVPTGKLRRLGLNSQRSGHLRITFATASPADPRICYVSQNREGGQELKLYDPVRQEERVIYKGGVGSLSFAGSAWSPDGRWIAFWLRGSPPKLMCVNTSGTPRVQELVVRRGLKLSLF